METIGIAEYNHKLSECYDRKIAELDGFCGDPRCRAAFAQRQNLADAELKEEK